MSVAAGTEIGWFLQGIEPADDPAWLAATETGRRTFWNQAGRIALVLYGRSREQGLDRFGKKLKALSPKTIKYRRSAMGPADKSAPPLIPAHGLSRTISYLRFMLQPGPSGELACWFYFAMDPHTRRNWGEILRYHARGEVPGAPIRDVLGFSGKEVATIKRQAHEWWATKRAVYAPAVIVRQYRWEPNRGRRVAWMESPVGSAPTMAPATVSPYTGRMAGQEFTRPASGRVLQILEGAERRVRGGVPPTPPPPPLPAPRPVAPTRPLAPLAARGALPPSPSRVAGPAAGLGLAWLFLDLFTRREPEPPPEPPDDSEGRRTESQDAELLARFEG